MRVVFSAAFVLSAFAASLAKQVIVTVGGSTQAPDGATTVFDPDAVTADIGDVVVFNFTQGNHTATQSTFAAPCIPLHDFDLTLNGFDSSFRSAGNFSAITNLSVNVTTSDTIWFFDWNTCAEGGVGGINVNGSNYLTLDGFRRNAMRLNGTATVNPGPSATRTPHAGPSGSEAGPSSSLSPSSGTNGAGAERAAGLGFMAVLPMVAAALLL
ncbi:hypothetical protein GSI_04258 [Ganoderma sinense ZZ0214-1]|uniref:Uncharacterized protein n=1 Tax=Ganoderma sinense ZZ0214-1 TaxID=1077348 RepID=A0A2G8SIM8_9APHY|nr:hypothetical protein GSI_04258 [Ganoderma sinense ZZ0214-1]